MAASNSPVAVAGMAGETPVVSAEESAGNKLEIDSD